MNNQKGSIVIDDIVAVSSFILMIIMFVGIVSVIFKNGSPRLQNHKECLEWVNEAIPDPNQTSERVELLKSCLGN